MTLASAATTRQATRVQVLQAQIHYLRLRIATTKMHLAHDEKLAYPNSPLIRTEKDQIRLYLHMIAEVKKGL